MNSDFLRTEFDGQSFQEIPANQFIVRGKNFYDCNFRNCDLSETDFSEATFEDCRFVECNFSMCRFTRTSFRTVEFKGCKFSANSFSACNPFSLEMTFSDCLLRGANFSDLKLRKCGMRNCMIVESDFLRTDLSEADLSGSCLKNTHFQDCNLSGANFCGASEYAINPLTNRIAKAKFSLPEAISLLQAFDIIIGDSNLPSA